MAPPGHGVTKFCLKCMLQNVPHSAPQYSSWPKALKFGVHWCGQHVSNHPPFSNGWTLSLFCGGTWTQHLNMLAAQPLPPLVELSQKTWTQYFLHIVCSRSDLALTLLSAPTLLQLYKLNSLLSWSFKQHNFTAAIISFQPFPPTNCHIHPQLSAASHLPPVFLYSPHNACHQRLPSSPHFQPWAYFSHSGFYLLKTTLHINSKHYGRLTQPCL